MPLVERLLFDHDGADFIATGNASFFVDLEVLAAADPVERFLEDADSQVAAGGGGSAAPADRAAHVLPDEAVIQLGELDHLIAELVEGLAKDIGADLELHVQRQEPEGEVGDAQHRAELLEAVLEAGPPGAQG